MRFCIVVLIGLLALPLQARAEGGCPPGHIPYAGTPALGSAASIASCGPIPSSQPAAPQWETRWGAIAEGGEFGIVTGMRSERKAKKAAIAECQKRGGTTCSTMLTFRNQCAAVVSSTTNSFAQGAAYEEDAVAAGEKRCRESNTGKCWVYYSGCSLPVRVN
ncbi:DUF4189 domain-containing protein [Pseudomonas sp. CGJS7]|uniref:DUF4189 domain-containing protein n=1 Tax=Pseudomonas sp. CGJS7 TaxID=3109348 RepID=UPI003FA7C433